MKDMVQTPKYERKPQRNVAKIPSPVYTDPECMEFIQKRDKSYKPGNKTKLRRELAKAMLLD